MLLPALLLAVPVRAQHEHAGPMPADSAGHEGMEMAEDTAGAPTPAPLGIPASRAASGTAWQPDATPMRALHARAGAWELMLHGNAFLQYVDEGGSRGSEQLGSVNWVMGMARRPLAGGELGLRAMLSAEPVTVGECGYPVLLQSGEACDGEALHDRQHPHDLFMELAAEYERELTPGLGLQLYGGPVGEPALGPVAFPHRASGEVSPSPPISHHWQDATHISFGVVTAGLFGRSWKLEGSLFNGREPDENRWDLDSAPLDSYSGRLWYLPGERWAFQFSAGRLTGAERAGDGAGAVDVDRYTASGSYVAPRPGGGVWATSAVWGLNREAGAATGSLLLESSLELTPRHALFGRAEWVQKTGHDLALPSPAPEDEVFEVSQLLGGYLYRLPAVRGWEPGIGGRISMSLLPAELEPWYGSRAPVGFGVWLRLAPASMGAGHASPMPPM
jgi:hypothetical protein